MTYSFPCQDLSLAGKTKGMSRGSGTRSGLLWEVERILNECGEELPQILLMENVPQVIGKKNIDDFKEWELFLESKGYQNYIQILNAKDYGIPQNRKRCFMVSILGDAFYEWPKKQPLKLKLSDMLEKEVDEKYFISSKMMDYLLGTNQKESKYNRHQVFTSGLKSVNEKNIAKTITTREGQRPVDTYLIVKEATKKGYKEAYVGDGVDISTRMETHRGTVQKGLAQTIKTQADVGVVVKTSQQMTEELIKDTQSGKYNDGHAYGKHLYQSSRFNDNPTKDISATIKSGNMDAGVINGLAIRKLTPKEYYRLMGFTDDDYNKAREVNTESQLYKQAGNSIVVNVLMAIFKQLL